MQEQKSSVFVFDARGDGNDAVAAPVSGAGQRARRTPRPESHPRWSALSKVASWGGIGAFWGGIAGLLLAPEGFFPAGLGLVSVSGPATAALGGAVEGALVLGGLLALGAAVLARRRPKDTAANR